MKKVWFVLLASLSFAGAVQAYEIRFEDGYTTDGQVIAADYGSIPGLIDVSYFDIHTSDFNLAFRSGMSGQPGAVQRHDGSPSSFYVFLTPLPGYKVTLNSFFLGSLGGLDRLTSYVVNDDATPWPIVDISSGPITVGAGGLHVLAGLSSADEIEIGVGPNAFGIGINYINFDVSPVPEPENWALLLAGLSLLGVGVRRHGVGFRHSPGWR